MENSEPKGIDYFYRDHWLAGPQMWLAFRVRKKMFNLWKNFAKAKNIPSTTALDIGATPDTERPDSNCFLKWMHEWGLKITCFSPEDISNIKSVFPYVNLLETHDLALCPPRQFDWSSSSAVLEHVGTYQNQIQFIREHGRVGNSIFLTTPNRNHWLEFHTKLPLIHWLPRPLHRKILKFLGLEFWANEKNLRLVSQSELTAMVTAALGSEFEITIQSVWALGMPSNLILLATKRSL